MMTLMYMMHLNMCVLYVYICEKKQTRTIQTWQKGVLKNLNSETTSGIFRTFLFQFIDFQEISGFKK
jgi:hypothetical protein